MILIIGISRKKIKQVEDISCLICIKGGSMACLPSQVNIIKLLMNIQNIICFRGVNIGGKGGEKKVIKGKK